VGKLARDSKDPKGNRKPKA